MLKIRRQYHDFGSCLVYYDVVVIKQHPIYLNSKIMTQSFKLKTGDKLSLSRYSIYVTTNFLYLNLDVLDTKLIDEVTQDILKPSLPAYSELEKNKVNLGPKLIAYLTSMLSGLLMLKFYPQNKFALISLFTSTIVILITLLITFVKSIKIQVKNKAIIKVNKNLESNFTQQLETYSLTSHKVALNQSIDVKDAEIIQVINASESNHGYNTFEKQEIKLETKMVVKLNPNYFSSFIGAINPGLKKLLIYDPQGLLQNFRLYLSYPFVERSNVVILENSLVINLTADFLKIDNIQILIEFDNKLDDAQFLIQNTLYLPNPVKNTVDVNQSDLKLSCNHIMLSDKLGIDIFSHNDGPHGLICGTTGSGKSKLLESVTIQLLEMPKTVDLILIDFKGGDYATKFSNFKNILAVVTNNDLNSLVYFKQYLTGEIKKRQVTKKNSLVIIVDEVAELKSLDPDIMRYFSKIARIGRSLNIHLILATQTPGNIIDDEIILNTNFKICLKVNAINEANKLVKNEAPANFSQPGEAYILSNSQSQYFKVKTLDTPDFQNQIFVALKYDNKKCDIKIPTHLESSFKNLEYEKSTLFLNTQTSLLNVQSLVLNRFGTIFDFEKQIIKPDIRLFNDTYITVLNNFYHYPFLIENTIANIDAAVIVFDFVNVDYKFPANIIAVLKMNDYRIEKFLYLIKAKINNPTVVVILGHHNLKFDLACKALLEQTLLGEKNNNLSFIITTNDYQYLNPAILTSADILEFSTVQNSLLKPNQKIYQLDDNIHYVDTSFPNLICTLARNKNHISRTYHDDFFELPKIADTKSQVVLGICKFTNKPIVMKGQQLFLVIENNDTVILKNLLDLEHQLITTSYTSLENKLILCFNLEASLVKKIRDQQKNQKIIYIYFQHPIDQQLKSTILGCNEIVYQGDLEEQDIISTQLKGEHTIYRYFKKQYQLLTKYRR